MDTTDDTNDTGGASRDNPLVGVEPSGPETDGWEPPVPLGTPKLPPFPGGVLPGWLDAYVSGLSAALQVPRDFAAVMALGAVSACVAGKAKVWLTPGYPEPLNLWIVAAMVSAAGKSGTVRAVSAPIAAWEATQAETMRDEISEAMSRLRIREGALQKAERAAATAENHERLRAESEAMAIAREVSTIHIPVVPRILTDDATAERIATLLMEHEGRLAILSPEGGVFDLMGGKYNNNIPNLDVFLKGHAGDTIRVDRQGRPPDFVPDPALTLVVSPQPDVLRGLTDKPGFRGRGLLARPLYCLPENLIGRRNWDAPPLADDIRDEYHRRLTELLTMPHDYGVDGKKRPYAVRLSPEALAAWKTFRSEIEPRLLPLADLGSIPDWGGKLWGAAARLAGVLHFALHGPCADLSGIPPISLPTMEAALALARYFIPHAHAAFGQMVADTATREAAHYILTWLERRGDKKTFTQRDCWRTLKRRFDKVDMLDAPFALLAEHLYIREIPDEGDTVAGVARATGRGGRPRNPRYARNPYPPAAADPVAGQAPGTTEPVSDTDEGVLGNISGVLGNKAVPKTLPTTTPDDADTCGDNPIDAADSAITRQVGPAEEVLGNKKGFLAPLSGSDDESAAGESAAYSVPPDSEKRCLKPQNGARNPLSGTSSDAEDDDYDYID